MKIYGIKGYFITLRVTLINFPDDEDEIEDK